MSWEKVLNIYKYKCINNKDFINIILDSNINIDTIYNDLNKSSVLNKDLKQATEENYNDLIVNYKNNNLITTRLGIVESRFILSYK